MSFIPSELSNATPTQEDRIKRLPVEGPLDCKICFVGEAHGSKEQASWRPFVGPAGQELDRLLHSAGITRTECYITNVIKDHPPGNEINRFIDTTKKIPVISPRAREHITQLREELLECSANVFVAVGGTSLYVLTENVGILKWRGSILESSLLPGKKVIPIIHPRAVLPPTGVYLWKHLIQLDLLRVVEESKYPELRLPSLILHTRPSLSEAMNFLQRCASLPLIDVDIEVLREEVSCIAFATNEFEAMSIPFTYETGDYWNPDDEAEIWRAITDILESSLIVKRGQNFLFDISFLLTKHGIRTVNIEDTMVAQGILYPDFKKGLDFITSTHTRIPYYKDEGKMWSRISGNWEQHWQYNAKDTLATAQAFPSQMSQLTQQGNLDTYKRQRNLIEPLSFMQQRGIRMNLDGIKRAHESVSQELSQLTEEFYKACGQEINPNSPKQLKEYFYIDKGIKPYVNRKTGADSVDAEALTRLSRKGHKEASILLSIRELSKLKGTYLEMELDEDGRIRCSFKPVGTATGRLSSGKTIFGRGGNLQNQPPEMKQMMLFDEGYIGYNIDLSQAENRIVAYTGPVPEMIQAFEEGKDVHCRTASYIFNIDEATIKQMDADDIKASLGGGSHTHRFWGKKSNHELNYDMGYRAFSLICEIPEAEGRFIVDKYHTIYPGVRQGFQTQIRNMLSRSRTITNLLGRKRIFLDRWGDSLFKSGYGHFPQSSVADTINERGLGYIYYNQDEFRPIELLLQTHDSITFQIPKNLPWIEHAIILRKIIDKLETPLQWRIHKFVIPTDLEMSPGNMGKFHSKRNPLGLKKIPRTPDIRLLADKLEEVFSTFNG